MSTGSAMLHAQSYQELTQAVSAGLGTLRADAPAMALPTSVARPWSGSGRADIAGQLTKRSIGTAPVEVDMRQPEDLSKVLECIVTVEPLGM